MQYPASALHREKLRPQPVMRSEQMDALEEIIAHAREATVFAKQALIFAIRQTNGLSRSVCISVPESSTTEVWKSLHAITSDMGPTRLNLVLKAMGTDYGISYRSGSPIGGCHTGDGGFNENSPSVTIFVSPFGYDSNAQYQHVGGISIEDITRVSVDPT